MDKPRYARHQISNRLAASQSSQRGTLREDQTSIALFGLIAVHADTIIPAPLFLSYKMTAPARIYKFSETTSSRAP